MTRNERTETTSTDSVVKENRNSKKELVESKIQARIQEYRSLIEECRSEGLNKLADLWVEELQTVIGNCQLEGLNVA